MNGQEIDLISDGISDYNTIQNLNHSVQPIPPTKLLFKHHDVNKNEEQFDGKNIVTVRNSKDTKAITGNDFK